MVCPAPKENLERVLGPLTNAEYQAHVWDRSVPDNAINPQYVKDTDIPDSRYFREAWLQNGNTVNVDMDKARDVHMDKIRAARNQELKALDIETMKGEDVQKEKQVLRDLPNNFDLTVAKTPEELKDLWPDELKGEVK